MYEGTATMAQTETHGADTLIPTRGALHDRATRNRLSAPGFRTFLAVSERWGLSVPQQLVLLGDVPATTYHHWKSKGVGSLSYDTLERVSLVLGIWKGLRLLFTDDAVALRWLRAPNTDLPFGELSPLDAMLRGSIDDLYAVRRYVDGWHGVWP